MAYILLLASIVSDCKALNSQWRFTKRSMKIKFTKIQIILRWKILFFSQTEKLFFASLFMNFFSSSFSQFFFFAFHRHITMFWVFMLFEVNTHKTIFSSFSPCCDYENYFNFTLWTFLFCSLLHNSLLCFALVTCFNSHINCEHLK